MEVPFGTLDWEKFGKSASTIEGFKTDVLAFKNAETLELHMEIERSQADSLLPPAIHPSIPSYALLSITRFPESPWGAFNLAEVRIAGRAGPLGRGFVLRNYTDNQKAARELAARWGYPVAPGEVKLRTFHDRVQGQVKVDNQLILEIEELDRELISGADIQLTASLHLARNKDNGKLVLVQVDPELVFSKAERGRPQVTVFRPESFGATSALRVTNPICAFFTSAEIKLPKIRFICDPGVPASKGTVKLAA